MIKIEQANGGYIVETNMSKTVFASFDDLVQFLARQFGEVNIGCKWSPNEN